MFDLGNFLTQGLIDSLNNNLLAPELITVYAGNYLAKSMITQDEMTQVSNAITAYKNKPAADAVAPKVQPAVPTSDQETHSTPVASQPTVPTQPSPEESTTASQQAADSATTTQQPTATPVQPVENSTTTTTQPAAPAQPAQTAQTTTSTTTQANS